MGAGIAGVVEDGCLTGVITDGDLRRNLDGLLSRRARDVATRNPVTVEESLLAVEAVALMNDRRINVLFVVSPDRRPLGVLHIQDCLRAGVV